MSFRKKLDQISTTLNLVFFEISSDYNEESILNALKSLHDIKITEEPLVDDSVLNQEQITITKEIESTLVQKQRVMERWLNLEQGIENKAKDINFCLYNGEIPGFSCALLEAERAMINLIADQRMVLREPLNATAKETVIYGYIEFLNQKLSEWEETLPSIPANRVFDALLDRSIVAVTSVYKDVLAGRAATSLELGKLPKSHY
ncbi:hypothetical protein UA32_12045 [Photobacterium angustum]|uniref:Uncharacterized protein n=1 Tax=Photobacterium angustum TaxID=661 RepID=A0ABX5GYN7_PHOAN|nr:hypothetical protein [Photobacterium angustum]KJG37688.1 hypothetical protein UA32_12045 [Photobacterium angustum]PSX03980.1 hypothetical protein C0W27_21030 [Photobacterium angustum]